MRIDSHVISYFIFVENWEKCLSQNLSSATVVIGAFGVISLHCGVVVFLFVLCFAFLVVCKSRVYKTVFMLDSTEHEISTGHKN